MTALILGCWNTRIETGLPRHCQPTTVEGRYSRAHRRGVERGQKGRSEEEAPDNEATDWMRCEVDGSTLQASCMRKSVGNRAFGPRQHELNRHQPGSSQPKTPDKVSTMRELCGGRAQRAWSERRETEVRPGHEAAGPQVDDVMPAMSQRFSRRRAPLSSALRAREPISPDQRCRIEMCHARTQWVIREPQGGLSAGVGVNQDDRATTQ